MANRNFFLFAIIFRLSSLAGFLSLTSINEKLAIWNNPSLSNLSGLDNLNTVEKLSIKGNSILIDLSSLEDISLSSLIDLTITENTMLSDCDIQSICDYLISPGGTVEIHDNAPGCNSQEEMEDACWTKMDEIAVINKGIKIFPNPASKTITIKSSAYIEIVEVSIFNLAGTKVLQQPAPVNEIDISKLRQGLYFVEVVTGKGTVRKKLVVE